MTQVIRLVRVCALAGAAALSCSNSGKTNVAPAGEKSDQLPGKSHPTQPLLVGQTATDFEALSQTGYRVRASQLLNKPLAVFFCQQLDKTCSRLSLAIANQWLSLNQKLSMVAIITPRGWNETRNFSAEYQLPQLLLSDHDNSIAQRFGLAPEAANSHAYLLGQNLEVLAAVNASEPLLRLTTLLQALPLPHSE